MSQDDSSERRLVKDSVLPSRSNETAHSPVSGSALSSIIVRDSVISTTRENGSPLSGNIVSPSDGGLADTLNTSASNVPGHSVAVDSTVNSVPRSAANAGEASFQGMLMFLLWADNYGLDEAMNRIKAVRVMEPDFFPALLITALDEMVKLPRLPRGQRASSHARCRVGVSICDETVL